ncbi:MAG: Lrp/AsnC family transcriptional regulator [Nitrosopumilus sp.]|nr:Lrp/AsnC family transcriptional regulator [Nitrosopumilus sp.]
MKSENDTSFVLLTCDESRRQHVVEQLKDMSMISDIIPVQGIYDILIKIEMPHEQLREMINTRIRYIDCVRSTLTLIDSK